MTPQEKKEKKASLIKLLSKTPIIETACHKVGINRMMYSRWKKEDSVFKEEVESVLSISRDTITDLAESQIINKIQDGHFGACTFWLRNNCNRYRVKKAIPIENKDLHTTLNLVITDAPSTAVRRLEHKISDNVKNVLRKLM